MTTGSTLSSMAPILYSPSENAIILEETPDKEYQPTQEEILKYARALGIYPTSEAHLMHIAHEGIRASLPQSWCACQDKNGDIFFFNRSTGTSSWDHPSDEIYRKRVQEARRLHRAGSVERITTPPVHPKSAIPIRVVEKKSSRLSSRTNPMDSPTNRRVAFQNVTNHQLPSSTPIQNKPVVGNVQTQLETSLAALSLSKVENQKDEEDDDKTEDKDTQYADLPSTNNTHSVNGSVPSPQLEQFPPSLHTVTTSDESGIGGGGKSKPSDDGARLSLLKETESRLQGLQEHIGRELKVLDVKQKHENHQRVVQSQIVTLERVKHNEEYKAEMEELRKQQHAKLEALRAQLKEEADRTDQALRQSNEARLATLECELASQLTEQRHTSESQLAQFKAKSLATCEEERRRCEKTLTRLRHKFGLIERAELDSFILQLERKKANMSRQYLGNFSGLDHTPRKSSVSFHIEASPLLSTEQVELLSLASLREEHARIDRRLRQLKSLYREYKSRGHLLETRIHQLEDEEPSESIDISEEAARLSATTNTSNRRRSDRGIVQHRYFTGNFGPSPVAASSRREESSSMTTATKNMSRRRSASLPRNVLTSPVASPAPGGVGIRRARRESGEIAETMIQSIGQNLGRVMSALDVGSSPPAATSSATASDKRTNANFGDSFRPIDESVEEFLNRKYQQYFGTNDKLRQTSDSLITTPSSYQYPSRSETTLVHSGTNKSADFVSSNAFSSPSNCHNQAAQDTTFTMPKNETICTTKEDATNSNLSAPPLPQPRRRRRPSGATATTAIITTPSNGYYGHHAPPGTQWDSPAEDVGSNSGGAWWLPSDQAMTSRSSSSGHGTGGSKASSLSPFSLLPGYNGNLLAPTTPS